MKAEIHPEYQDSRIVCACGRVTETRATVPELHVEICSHCHPFFTGKQKLVDTAGRVERFLSKYGREEDADELAAEVQERADSSEKMEMPDDMQVQHKSPFGSDEEGEAEAGEEGEGSVEVEEGPAAGQAREDTAAAGE